MAKTKLKGQELGSDIILPEIGQTAPDFCLVRSDLSETTLSDYRGVKVILNIYPSIDTSTCAISTKRFNQELENLNQVKVLCISKDLPFAQSRFCEAEGIERVETLSAFRSDFGKDYGVVLTDSPLRGLFARAIIVIDKNAIVLYHELVDEIGKEPDYVTALNAVKHN